MMIIDIRSSSKYENGHIEGAISIPFKELITKYDKYLTFDEEYYIYCDSGNTSSMLVNYLNKLGYHCVNIDGGYANYLLRE